MEHAPLGMPSLVPGQERRATKTLAIRLLSLGRATGIDWQLREVGLWSRMKVGHALSDCWKDHRTACSRLFHVRLCHERRYIRYDWGMKERGEKGVSSRSPKEVRFAVRPGRKDDAAEAARLWMRSAEEHAFYDTVYATAPDAEKIMRRFLAGLSASSDSCLFVAEADGKMIGFLSGELREGSPAFKPKTWAAVEDIYVTPGYRGLGVGRALFKECQKWAKKKGADGVSLQVAADNVHARKFYEELGFREVSVYEVKEFYR